MKWILFILFIIGMILVILGWFFDRMSHFPGLMRRICPDYMNGITTLNTLARDNKVAITEKHPGFNVILKSWPGMTEKSRVRLIGRSAAYMGFGAQVTSDIQLIAFGEDHKEIGSRWKISSARSLLVVEKNKRVFWIGATVFWVGILISSVSGLLEFLAIRTKT